MRIIFWFIIFYPKLSLEDLFSSHVHINELVKTEAAGIEVLRDYIREEENRIVSLKRILEKWEKDHNLVGTDGEKYLSNPINVFYIIRRMTMDWSKVENLMIQGNREGIEVNITKLEESHLFPNVEDIQGAVEAINRIKFTYNLNTSLIAEGKLSNAEQTTPMSGKDLYELGRQSFNAGDLACALEWLKLAMEKEDEIDDLGVSEWEKINYLSNATYIMGVINASTSIGSFLLKNENHKEAYHKLMEYRNLIKNAMNATYNGILGFDKPLDYEYYKICRNEVVPAKSQIQNLKCQYVSNTPYLRLAPLKLEEVHSNPKIVIYRNIISDEEIETLKNASKPLLKRAKVNSKEGFKTSSRRTSKTAFMTMFDSPVVSSITKRAEVMTGHRFPEFQLLAVASYGIGGHYHPHYDQTSVNRSNITFGTWGNRISTALIYLNDVEQGGSTAFLNLNLSVRAEKGTALVWSNTMFDNGLQDPNTLHMACPVLRGTKWIVNVWFHENSQNFIQKCANLTVN